MHTVLTLTFKKAFFSELLYSVIPHYQVPTVLNRLHAVKDIADLAQPAVTDFSSITSRSVLKAKSTKSRSEGLNTGKSKRVSETANSNNSPGCSTAAATVSHLCNEDLSESSQSGGSTGRGE